MYSYDFEFFLLQLLSLQYNLIQFNLDSISIYFRSLIAYKVRVNLDYCWKYKPMRELCVGAYLVARVEGPYKTPAVIDNGRPG